ncbi:MAG: histidinol-phosphatase HisJ family protein [Schaedlerella sp.]|nr:histidinol-phosphatase HisJ family protein [Schaedlerella sp.]
MIKADFHMHTEFSTDCQIPARTMILGAIGKGLETICITDHYDADYPFYEEMGEDAFNLPFDSYVKELQKLQEEFADRIDVRIGVELGLQAHLKERYQKIVEKYPFDFVIGSIHLVKGKDPYFREAYGDVSDTVLYREAFETTLENLKTNPPTDILAHLDYVVRYGRYQEEEYSYQKYADLIDEILKTVIEQGKGIELNMAGFKYGLPFGNPHPDVIRRYRELGGEIITVGADGHRPEHIAFDFWRASMILKDCGFRYYTEFKGRKPVFKKLP